MNIRYTTAGNNTASHSETRAQLLCLKMEEQALLTYTKMSKSIMLTIFRQAKRKREVMTGMSSMFLPELVASNLNKLFLFLNFSPLL